MEPFSKSDRPERSEATDKKEEETRRRGPRGFLESYLRAFYPDRLKGDKKEDDEEDEEVIEKSPKKSRFEKWWENNFKDRVEVEPVSEDLPSSSRPEVSKANETRSEADINRPDMPEKIVDTE